MRIQYKNNRVQSYCEEYRAAMREFKNRDVVLKLLMLMTDLRATAHIVDFSKVPKLMKYNIHDLHNDKSGEKSLRVTFSYRMEIIVNVYEEDGKEDLITILGVTNHYA